MAPLPSLQALPGRSRDDGFLSEAVGLVATKRQIAVVRTLADELERCLQRGGTFEMLREQLVHELARLGSCSLETAAAIAGERPDADRPSGVHPVALATTYSGSP
jgi:hypothetical protein